MAQRKLQYLTMMRLSMMAVLGLFVLVFIVNGGVNKAPDLWPYTMLLIDAGSSGSRAHVFFYRHPNKSFALPIVQLPQVSFSVTPGLSAFSTRPERVRGSIRELLSAAKPVIPTERWTSTPVLLVATAGLRMLPLQESQLLLIEARKELAASGLHFMSDWASIASGQEEGIYAWIATNYASGALTAAGAVPGAQETCFRSGDQSPVAPLAQSGHQLVPAVPMAGIVEMGGASLQVTFQPAHAVPASFLAPLSLPQQYGCALFTHSFAGWGREAAMARVVTGDSSPCLFAGYVSSAGTNGSGSLPACMDRVRQALAVEGAACTFASCLLDGVPNPGVVGHLVATENLARVAKVLRVGADATVGGLEAAGVQLCATEWNSILASHMLKNEGPEDTAKHCFMAAFAVVFFRDVLGISDTDQRLSFQSEVTTPDGASVPLDWPLGAMVAHSFRLEQWSVSMRRARIGGVREVGGRLPLQADEAAAEAGSDPVAVGTGDGGPGAATPNAPLSAGTVLMWALLWSGLGAAALSALRAWAPAQWKRLCASIPYLRRPLVFDLQRGSYRELSDKAMSTLHGVSDSVVESLKFPNLLSVAASPMGKRSRAQGRPPLL